MENEDPDYTPEPAPKTKVCPICQKRKPKSEFYTRGAGSHYLASYCKNCHTSPFKDARIVCPHCNEKIYFVGIDADNQIITNHSKARVAKDLVKKTKRQLKEIQPKTNLKDLLK